MIVDLGPGARVGVGASDEVMNREGVLPVKGGLDFLPGHEGILPGAGFKRGGVGGLIFILDDSGEIAGGEVG